MVQVSLKIESSPKLVFQANRVSFFRHIPERNTFQPVARPEKGLVCMQMKCQFCPFQCRMVCGWVAPAADTKIKGRIKWPVCIRTKLERDWITPRRKSKKVTTGGCWPRFAGVSLPPRALNVYQAGRQEWLISISLSLRLALFSSLFVYMQFVISLSWEIWCDLSPFNILPDGLQADWTRANLGSGYGKIDRLDNDAFQVLAI